MGDRYLVDLDDVCRRTGYPVIEVDGWQSRARGSGGFNAGKPDHIMDHHTASGPGADGWDDVNYCTFHDDDAPLCNLYLSRVPEIFVCAAGATNTNGSGDCSHLSPDTMNSSAIGIEAGNDGVGEPWNDAQQDAYVKLCVELCAAYGIDADRIHSHQEWAPTRKSDPAGPSRWAGSGTWAMDGFRGDVAAGGGPTVPPPHPGGGGGVPPQGEDDDMFDGIWKRENHDACYACYKDGTKQWLMDLGYIQGVQNLQRMRGATEEMVNVRTMDDPGLFAAMGYIIGPRPDGVDEWGNS